MVWKCPGYCPECKGHNGLPICASIRKNETVLFKLHGQGVKPESAKRARVRYLENIQKAFRELTADYDWMPDIKSVRNSSNRKTGDIPCINMPALMTCSGEHANTENGCGNGTCYAVHGLQATYPAVRARVRNYLLYKRDPDRFWGLVDDATRNSRFARYHDSGDIVDYDYLCGMVEQARKRPGTIYWTMTKKFDIVNRYIDQNGDLPGNLVIMPSGWSCYNVDDYNPHSLPVTGVYSE